MERFWLPKYYCADTILGFKNKFLSFFFIFRARFSYLLDIYFSILTKSTMKFIFIYIAVLTQEVEIVVEVAHEAGELF